MSFKEIDMVATVPWLTWAKSKIGVHEIPGPGDNPEIDSWFKFTTLDKADWHDATPWCSVFVNAAFGLTGFKGTGSAAAISWAKWGHEVEYDEALPGDVVVFEWDSGGHHVALLETKDDNRVKVLGGNQGSAGEVSERWFSKNDVINVRRA
jgi:uncharacterized protein (TIGR02594 family)